MLPERGVDRRKLKTAGVSRFAVCMHRIKTASLQSFAEKQKEKQEKCRAVLSPDSKSRCFVVRQANLNACGKA